MKRLITLLYFLRRKNSFCKINPSRPDCGVSGQRSAGLQKLHLLAGAARLHQGHQHPPALPAHQHPARSPDLQGPERSHGHTQGRDLSLYGLIWTCPAVRLLLPDSGKDKFTSVHQQLTAAHSPSPSCSHTCHGLMPGLSVRSHHGNNFGRGSKDGLGLLPQPAGVIICYLEQKNICY